MPDGIGAERRRIALSALDKMETAQRAGSSLSAAAAVTLALDESDLEADLGATAIMALHVEALSLALKGLDWHAPQEASIGVARRDPSALYAPFRPRRPSECAQPLDAVDRVRPVAGRVGDE